VGQIQFSTVVDTRVKEVGRRVTPFGSLESVKRLAAGEPCLAWLAADLGFADHATATAPSASNSARRRRSSTACCGRG